MTIKVINNSNNSLPQYETDKAAGLDVRADFSKITPETPIKLYGDGEVIFGNEIIKTKILRLDPGSRVLIPTGLCVAIPEGYEIQVRPRSGQALKKGITVLNTPGCIDSDYRGEIGVILINQGLESVWIEDGERIAQLILNKIERIEWYVVDTLDKTSRDSNGFGTTGVK